MNTPATEAFVPLMATTAPGAEPGEFLVAVLKEADGMKSLQPLPKQPVIHATDASPAACEPRVTLQREGDRVCGIRIECVCGAVMDLHCVYDSAR